jgi:opacity protein-like surface antigen
MKKFLIIAVLCIAGVTTSNAQSLRFGVKAGANFANLEGDDVDGNTYTNFHFGALLELNVLQNFSIQPELLYSSQGAEVDSEAFDKIEYKYLTVPVLAKFYVITDKLSIEAGPQFGFMIDDNLSDVAETKSFDFAAIGGLGLNITDNIFAQARYVIGLTDTTKDAEIKNKVIQVSLGYRF